MQHNYFYVVLFEVYRRELVLMVKEPKKECFEIEQKLDKRVILSNKLKTLVFKAQNFSFFGE